MHEAITELLKTCGMLCFAGAYMLAIIYVSLSVSLILGVWTWVFVGLMLAPFVALCVHIWNKREKLNLENQLKPYSNVNIEKDISDYVDSQMKKKKEET